MRGYPKGFLTLLLFSLIVCSLTGLLLIPPALELKFFITIFNPTPELFSAYIPVLHASVAFLLFGIVWALWAVHIRMGWRKKQNRVTGIILVLGFLFLFMSGMGLYYCIDENYLNYSSAMHMVVGILINMIFMGHYLYAKK